MINIICGDALVELKKLPDNHVNCCVTSPPYWGLHDYNVEKQIGLEKKYTDYIFKLTKIFREVKRVLGNDGTMWINIGDSYCGYNTRAKTGLAWHGNKGRVNHARGGKGLKNKDMVGIPWRLAFALRDDGWYLRQDIIWHKPNPTPESIVDRCTKAHEFIFLFSKNYKYYYDQNTIKEKTVDGKGLRNKRSVWTVKTARFSGAHFATFPVSLITPCILAGSPAGGIVLDPFSGAGTTGLAANRVGRGYIGIELNPDYVKMSKERILNDSQLTCMKLNELRNN